MRTEASCVPRSTTSCAASASSTASRSATPRWSNATTIFTRPPGDESSPGASRHPFEERRRARDDVVDVVAETLEHGRPGRGSAEAVECDRVAVVADPPVPAERDAGLDGDARPHVRWEHL